MAYFLLTGRTCRRYCPPRSRAGAAVDTAHRGRKRAVESGRPARKLATTRARFRKNRDREGACRNCGLEREGVEGGADTNGRRDRGEIQRHLDTFTVREIQT